MLPNLHFSPQRGCSWEVMDQASGTLPLGEFAQVLYGNQHLLNQEKNPP